MWYCVIPTAALRLTQGRLPTRHKITGRRPVSQLTDRLSKIDTLALSDKINAEKKIEDMKDFVLVSLYHTLKAQNKFSDKDISEMLEALEVVDVPVKNNV
jgi:hypothetical protein